MYVRVLHMPLVSGNLRPVQDHYHQLIYSHLVY